MSLTHLAPARLRHACLVALAVLVCLGDSARATTWADRLGYPEGSRVLIIHAGEAGLAYETNAAAKKPFEAGVVKSVAGMAPAPWFADFSKWAESQSTADFGLELTINSELADYRFQPVASDVQVASLVDADGNLWRLPLQTASNALAEDVAIELRAQLTRAKAAGWRPTHLSAHLGALLERPDLIEAYLRLAREEWIPATVVELAPDVVESLAHKGYPLPEDVIAAFEEYPLPKLDALRFVPGGTSYEAKKQALLDMLRDLPPGLTQIEFRPAAASEALPRIVDDAQQRQWDADLLADEEVIQALRAEGTILTDWREVMRRFEGGSQQPQAETSQASGPVNDQ
jgi:chitin disaccharide deacetylase